MWICHTFDILDHLIMRFCVDVGHLGKWRRVRIAHPSGDVITQFCDPHTSMIDFRHADKCWYSAATYSKNKSLFWASAAALTLTPSQFSFSGTSRTKYTRKNFLSSIFGRTDLHEAEKRLGMDHAAELVNRTLCGCSADDYWPLLTQWILTTNFKMTS